MIIRTDLEAMKKHNVNSLIVDSKQSWETAKDFDKCWAERYKYEAERILTICKVEKLKKVLELGSGPGVLSQLIIENGIKDYTLVDLDDAKKMWKSRGYKGKFIVKDMENFLDIGDLDKNYDLIIMNDFLEHIRNPSNIISQCRKLLSEKGCLFISVPNWRMGHLFFYRGLFDYDNFIYFMNFHGFVPKFIYPGTLFSDDKIPLVDSESDMPKELHHSWNWYTLFKKEKLEK